MKKTVEAVTTGHPDNVCDQMADAIVDEFLRRDPKAHVRIRILGSGGMLVVGGSVCSRADFDCSLLVKQVYQDVGYTDDIEVFVNIDHQQPPKDFVHPSGVVAVNGYATRETREFMPRPCVFAQNFVRRIDDLRKTDPAFSWIRPDGTVQLVMQKDRVQALTLLVSHTSDIGEKDVQTALLDRLVQPLIGEDGVQVFINPAGPFTTYGFQDGVGVNGSKLAVDTYGGLIPHGSDGGFSGMDPYAPERAGAYMARYAARYLVEQGLVQTALVNVAYTSGRAEPLHVEAQGIGDKGQGVRLDLGKVVRDAFDFRPEAIVERLSLARPLYRQASMYGQFGRPGFPWEESVES